MYINLRVCMTDNVYCVYTATMHEPGSQLPDESVELSSEWPVDQCLTCACDVPPYRDDTMCSHGRTIGHSIRHSWL